MTGLYWKHLRDSQQRHVLMEELPFERQLELADSEQQFCALVGNGFGRGLGESGSLSGDTPEEGIRVEQHSHEPRSSVNSRSVKGQSQPLRNTIFPAALPSPVSRLLEWEAA